MIEEVAGALTRVLGHPVSLRADTPLSSFGPWPSLAVLVAQALFESTGITLSDATLLSAVIAEDLALALEQAVHHG